jgi:hypothetical protein
MKKLLIILGAVGIFSFNSMGTASSQEAENATVPSTGEAMFEMPPSMIDDIEVPNDVLMYVQMEYQGHAVTKASKISRNGGEVYRLLVDSDDKLYNNEFIYLLYDLNWQLIGEEKNQPAPVEVKPAAVEEDKKVEEPKPEQAEEGRGGGFIEEGEAPPGAEEDLGEEPKPEDPPAVLPAEEPAP